MVGKEVFPKIWKKVPCTEPYLVTRLQPTRSLKSYLVYRLHSGIFNAKKTQNKAKSSNVMLAHPCMLSAVYVTQYMPLLLSHK